MNNTLHTWQISFGNIVDQNKKTICFLPERKNNDTARLISAAPDLLSTLEGLLKIAEKQLDQSATHEGLLNCQALANARAALRKAKGEA
jgi:hypothetical protein